MFSSDEILRSASWGAVNAGSKIAIQVVSLVVLARHLEPDEFGLAALATATVYWLNLFVEHGFSEAIVQREALHPHHVHTAFWTASAAGAALLVLGIQSAPMLEARLGEAGFGSLLSGACLVLVLSGPQGVIVAVLRRELRFREIALGTSVGYFAGAAAAIAMAVAGYGVWSLIGQRVATYAFSLTSLWVLSSWRPRLVFSMARLRELRGFALASMAGDVTSAGTNQIFQLMIGQLLGITALGFFNLACRIAASLSGVLELVSRQISMSVFARRQGDHEALRRSIYSATQVCCVLAAPVFFGLIACAPEVVEVFFGAKWLPSVPLVALVSLGCVFFFLQSSMEVAIDALGRPIWRVALGLLEFLVWVGCLYAFRDTGLLAAGLAALVARIVAVPATHRILRRFMDVRLRVIAERCAAPLAAGVAMLGSVWLGRLALHGRAPETVLLTSLVLGALVYAGTLFVLAPVLARDLSGLLIRMARRRESRAAG